MKFLRSAAGISVKQRHLRMRSISSQRVASSNDVIIERVGDNGLIILNRPKLLNSLTLSMFRAIHSAIKQWNDESLVKCIVIKGVGGKAFSAGGDIRALAEDKSPERQMQKDAFREEYTLNNAIGTLTVPYIALIDGIVMGAGVGLSVHGRYRVATERSLFAMPENAIGLFPDVGGGYFLPRMQGKLGLYLGLTGYRLKGVDVLHSGVATHFVQSSQIGELEKELLSLSSANPLTIEKVLQGYQSKCLSEIQQPFSLSAHLNQINKLFNAGTVEEIVSNLQKDGSEWSTAQANTIAKMSPTSLKISMRQLREGASMTLQQVLCMEYRLSQRCMTDHDFFEGVRAVIVDKDQKPVWKPARLEDVTDEKVNSYFAPLSVDQELKL